MLCTIAQYPAIQELYLANSISQDASHIDCPLVRDSRQLETLTISQGPTASSLDPSSIVRHYKHVNLDMYTRSLRRFRFYSRFVCGPVEQFESGLQEVASDFARRGRNIEIELIRWNWRNSYYY